VAIGLLMTHEPSEAARSLAVSALIRAHESAIAQFAALRMGH